MLRFVSFTCLMAVLQTLLVISEQKQIWLGLAFATIILGGGQFYLNHAISRRIVKLLSHIKHIVNEGKIIHMSKVHKSFVILALLVFGGNTWGSPPTGNDIAEKGLHATVILKGQVEYMPGQFFDVSGTGFFVRQNLIATNYHVIEGVTNLTTKLVGKDTWFNIDGIDALDKSIDLAILQVSPSDIDPLPLGDSDSVKIGSEVHVIGNPSGYEGIYSDGKISGIQGNAGEGKYFLMTASMSPGNSGGPVLDEGGDVIGIATAISPEGVFLSGKEEVIFPQHLNRAVASNHLRDLLKSCDGILAPVPVTGADRETSAKIAIMLRVAAKAFEQHQYGVAILAYDYVIGLDPSNPHFYSNRAAAKLLLGEYDASIVDCNTAIQLQPNHPIAYCNRAHANRALSRFNNAIADFNQAIRYGLPNSVSTQYMSSIHVKLGNIKSRLEQYGAAIVEFDHAIGLDHDNYDAYIGRALARFMRSDESGAYADLRKALKFAEQAGDQDAVTNIKETITELGL